MVFLVISIYGITITAKNIDNIFGTIVLFFVVLFLGLFWCNRLSIKVADNNLKTLSIFWVVKLLLTLLVLFAGWVPFLDPSSVGWGYDPQRYYYQSMQLIENDWIFLGGLNYVGILYYYGLVFSFFGHNPVIPALINSIVTLGASLSLVRYIYEILPRSTVSHSKMMWLILIPEIVWFDVLTSRETLIGSLLVFAFTSMGMLVLRRKRNYGLYTIILISMLLIAAVRTSMLLPVVVSGFLYLILLKSTIYTRLRQLISLTIILILIGYINITSLSYIGLGEETFNVTDAINTATSAKENIATTAGSDVQYSANSVSALLLPEGAFQSMLFLFPRLVLYLVSPLPNIGFSLSGIFDGNWQDWQKAFTVISSFMNILLMPYVLAATFRGLMKRKSHFEYLTIIIPFWSVYIAISGGNLIIHERYRVMATLLLVTVAYLGTRIASRKLLSWSYLGWYGTLFSGAIFYITFKFLS